VTRSLTRKFLAGYGEDEYLCLNTQQFPEIHPFGNFSENYKVSIFIIKMLWPGRDAWILGAENAYF
jgi:hypothetical protein